ncbi:WLM domain-containing protein [Dendryphion nanum]|uniref:WLM domain-containing protein n=1 Tax=Dendryphion nanum TaxID=256645 RepID=A0A9P9D0A9_9PLEO|nr:WLM domain-containing protein [Dendryphion nanum]
MPLGFERLNERTHRPNALINFIRPLPGRTVLTAEAILNRVAAVCYPFMKKHMILVQALEEFPHNNEFVGRNFNAGEVIQLVLRNKQGQWLPERWVMMVMVHELAHCKQMNHSKAFWRVRDTYAADLRELWSKGYSGEGLWGRGRDLDTGHIHTGSIDVGDVPEHLCGGTYGSRAKKRKKGRNTKDVLSYAERKQRRILKKFGAGGKSLGADDDAKVKLEGGVAKKGKPRVAGSARGRELRAAAALSRFETVKKEDVVIKKEEESDSDTEYDYEDIGDDEAAIDVDGTKLLDGKGRALVKICEDEDDSDGNAMREMEELLGVDEHTVDIRLPKAPKPSIPTPASLPSANRDSSTNGTAPLADARSFRRAPSTKVIHLDELYKRRPTPSNTAEHQENPKFAQRIEPQIDCSICSLANEAGSLTCMACSHVLNVQLDPDAWNCRSATCTSSKYINSGDVVLCGVCGTSKKGQ